MQYNSLQEGTRMPRLKGSADLLEDRRRRALALWDTARIAEVIRREFGVHYHRDHVGRLMHRLKWSPQKPETRAVERDEEAIERWKRKDWPRVKKRSAAGRPPSL